eukprot:11182172-Lingulodinium_polyedra.AAC.1
MWGMLDACEGGGGSPGPLETIWSGVTRSLACKGRLLPSAELISKRTSIRGRQRLPGVESLQMPPSL